MNKKSKIILMTITLISGILFMNQMKYRNDELYAVNLKNKLDNDLVSILVSDGSENYTKYEGSTFPSNTEYTYNSELSKCQDNNGNVIEGILSYNETTSKVSIRTKKTTYCYLYFDKLSSSFADELIASGSLWQSGLEGDGYRYTGSGKATDITSPNNFICFGTISLTECKANESKYMYRIIGVFPDESWEQHLKLVKYLQLNEKYKWHSSDSLDISWEQSDLYKGLNGISGGNYNNLFIGNPEYDYLQETNWLNKIADWKWTATNTLTNEASGPDYEKTSAEQIYLHEMNRSTKTNIKGEWTYPTAKIGLMYASDFMLSLGSSALTMISFNDLATLRTGWLHQLNNGALTNDDTWLITRSGWLYYSWGSWYEAYVLVHSGQIFNVPFDDYYIVFPVFYLTSTVTISSGTGSYSDPYIIQE